MLIGDTITLHNEERGDSILPAVYIDCPPTGPKVVYFISHGLINSIVVIRSYEIVHRYPRVVLTEKNIFRGKVYSSLKSKMFLKVE